jgi:uncharacterized membrane protein (UPF0127 family)
MGNNRFFAVILLIICGLYSSVGYADQHVTFTKESIAVQTGGEKHIFHTEIATTEIQLQTGLMFRKNIDEDSAMLFIFDNMPLVNMWMKNTLIPLDMLFIGPDGKIVYIKHDAKPQSLDVINAGALPVQAVMELKGGIAAKKHINIGDRVIYKAFRQ